MTEYEGFRTPGGRLTEAQLPHLQSHRTELLGDSLPAIHAFDKAHVVMLTECGLLSHAHGAAMLAAFRRMEERGIAQVRSEVQGGMHSGEQYLIRELGIDVGGRIHIGRSSGDLIEVARRMTLRHHLHAVLGELCDVRGALLDLAGRHLDTVMPAYTHGQHAQPTTLAHWATMFERAFARDTERILQFHGRCNLSPAGAAILTGSDFPVDRHRVSELLGFDAPLPHTMDAILSHDLEMEAAGLLATATATIARLADDLILWSTAEFSYIDLPDRFCGTSSIMPQKKNPDALEVVKSLASQALAGLVSIVTAERGPTGFPILERRHSQELLWSLTSQLGHKLADVAEIVTHMRIDGGRMRHAAGAHWAQVTDLASALVRHTGLAWRPAHQVVALFVRLSVDAGHDPTTAAAATLDEAATKVTGAAAGLAPAVFAAAMDAAAFVERRTLYGGPAPQAARREMDVFASALAHDAAQVTALRARSRRAEERLEAAIDAIVEAPR